MLLYKMMYCNEFVRRKKSEIGNEKWINIDEAAEYLGVKPGTIRDWIRKNKRILAHKIGKQWKFKCSELDEWVNGGNSAIDQLGVTMRNMIFLILRAVKFASHHLKKTVKGNIK